MVLVAVFVAGSSCAVKYTMRGTGAVQAVAPRAETCDFAIHAASPSAPFDELVVIEAIKNPTKTEMDFKDSVRKSVCKAGGDAVVVAPDAEGLYTRATVIRMK